jgi:DNA-binding beta-propeller fold protein YncE
MPFGVTVSPDGKRVFVVNVDSRNVSILPTDLSSLTGETFPVDKGSTDIQVGSNNRTIYVVSESTNSILITDIP